MNHLYTFQILKMQNIKSKLSKKIKKVKERKKNQIEEPKLRCAFHLFILQCVRVPEA